MRPYVSVPRAGQYWSHFTYRVTSGAGARVLRGPQRLREAGPGAEEGWKVSVTRPQGAQALNSQICEATQVLMLRCHPCPSWENEGCN